MKRTGQAAMEYLILTGFTMLILMVLLIAAYTRMAASEKQIDMNAAERGVNKLMETADFVYIHGHPTKLTVQVYFPNDISHSYVDNKTINLAMNVQGEHTDVWRSTRGEVGWDLGEATTFPDTEGYFVFIVESTDYDSIYNGTINIHQ
jgi:hypothetical protein